MILNNNGKVGLRYDTKANWEKFNPILDKGEMIVEQDNGKCYLKVGDGKSKYNNLAYTTSKIVCGEEFTNCPSQTLRVLPYISNSLIEGTHNTTNYLKELLIYICKNYPNINQNNVFIGNISPNSQGICMIHIYDTNITKDGLPRYSSGMYNTLGNEIILFGTYDYVFRHREI